MWAYNSVFYQIYPIGFCGAPTANDGITVPRIRKIMKWTDYLLSLIHIFGVNCFFSRHATIVYYISSSLSTFFCHFSLFLLQICQNFFPVSATAFFP